MNDRRYATKGMAAANRTRNYIVAVRSAGDRSWVRGFEQDLSRYENVLSNWAGAAGPLRRQSRDTSEEHHLSYVACGLPTTVRCPLSLSISAGSHPSQ